MTGPDRTPNEGAEYQPEYPEDDEDAIERDDPCGDEDDAIDEAAAFGGMNYP